jgi:ABC-2 type transport system ATP-binding protein
MLGSPRVLILDEPSNGLDPAGIREIRELLRTLATDRGLAIFVSSHLLGEVELMCDRVAIIHRGRILKDGPVKDLISSQRAMEFKVNDALRAVAVLQAAGAPVTSQVENAILVTIEESEAPPLIAAMVREGIEVFHARPKIQTLEEMFIEVTGGETVD